MDDNTIAISLSDEERDFISEQIASGAFADENAAVHAGLALLEHQAKVKELRRLIAEGDADFANGDYMTFENPGDLTRYIIENAEALK
jgi:putative addiction module CopG family antidote